MKVALAVINGSEILVALVASADTAPDLGNAIMARIQPHFPCLPIMLVSIEDNGFKAHAAFRTSKILALVQLEDLLFQNLDLDMAIEGDLLPF